MNETDEPHRSFLDLKLRLTLASESFKFVTSLPNLSDLKRLRPMLTAVSSAFQGSKHLLD